MKQLIDFLVIRQVAESASQYTVISSDFFEDINIPKPGAFLKYLTTLKAAFMGASRKLYCSAQTSVACGHCRAWTSAKRRLPGKQLYDTTPVQHIKTRDGTTVLAQGAPRCATPTQAKNIRRPSGVGPGYEELLDDDDDATDLEIASVISDIESDDEDDSEMGEIALAPTDDED
ncbi:hypothetical protein HAX54_013018 [Datura stramonium]|uniref:Uncharacterized protein n=1 Tax=Datura stramonium TaxID=4076 RepID=A0ABS8TML7_DATST|nr:hypothetical protein [Datura stramonium]